MSGVSRCHNLQHWCAGESSRVAACSDRSDMRVMFVDASSGTNRVYIRGLPSFLLSSQGREDAGDTGSGGWSASGNRILSFLNLESQLHFLLWNDYCIGSRSDRSSAEGRGTRGLDRIGALFRPRGSTRRSKRIAAIPTDDFDATSVLRRSCSALQGSDEWMGWPWLRFSIAGASAEYLHCQGSSRNSGMCKVRS